MAAASRLSFFRSTISHFYRFPVSKPLLHPLFRPHFRLVSSPPAYRLAAAAPTTLHPHRSFSAAADSATATPGLVSSHPWPEWVSFIDKLKDKGYFVEYSSSGDEDPHNGPTSGLSDLNRLKTACMNFARERFDIIRLLSKEDIKAVVESGCPNLLRKSVNSSKRLRSYVRLDEGEVCCACNLRGSCDRAYLVIKTDEVARTVDVMRILMSYAMEPLTSSTDKCNGRENVEASARKLLSVLTELCDSAIDPSLQKPVVKSFDKKEKFEIATVGENKFQTVEMKRGDWICSKCNFMNFSRNIRCLKCKENGPKQVNDKDVEMQAGDWICPECKFMNFARNAKCFRCQESRPKGQLQDGEWECPSCKFINFRRNINCLKCSCERPKGGHDPYEDQMWRKPRLCTEKNNYVGDIDDKFA